MKKLFFASMINGAILTLLYIGHTEQKDIALNIALLICNIFLMIKALSIMLLKAEITYNDKTEASLTFLLNLITALALAVIAWHVYATLWLSLSAMNLAAYMVKVKELEKAKRCDP